MRQSSDFEGGERGEGRGVDVLMEWGYIRHTGTTGKGCRGA